MPEVYAEFKDQGFTILAFPCNQFADQEPYSNEKIDAFRKSKNATFPFFAKSNVNAPACDTSDSDMCQPTSNKCCPDNNKVYEYLRSVLPGDIGWNFEKFLVGTDGVPVKRYKTEVDPSAITDDIAKLLAGQPLDQ